MAVPTQTSQGPNLNLFLALCMREFRSIKDPGSHEASTQAAVAKSGACCQGFLNAVLEVPEKSQPWGASASTLAKELQMLLTDLSFGTLRPSGNRHQHGRQMPQ